MRAPSPKLLTYGVYQKRFGREAHRLWEFRFVGVLRRMEKKLATLGEAPPVKDSARTRKAKPGRILTMFLSAELDFPKRSPAIPNPSWRLEG